MIANFKQWAIMGVAILCLLAGLATVWLPIPTGVPLMALGVFLVIAYSKTGRSWVRRLRNKWRWLDDKIVWLEDRAGKTIGRVLKTTRPFWRRKR